MCKLIHMFQGQIGDEINNFSNCSLSRRPGGHEHTTEEQTNTHGTPYDKKQFLIHTLNKQPLNKLYPLNKQKTGRYKQPEITTGYIFISVVFLALGTYLCLGVVR